MDFLATSCSTGVQTPVQAGIFLFAAASRGLSLALISHSPTYSITLSLLSAITSSLPVLHITTRFHRFGFIFAVCVLCLSVIILMFNSPYVLSGNTSIAGCFPVFRIFLVCYPEWLVVQLSIYFLTLEVNMSMWWMECRWPEKQILWLSHRGHFFKTDELFYNHIGRSRVVIW
jgi:hypothetical protein